jgi:hypothetical protein
VGAALIHTDGQTDMKKISASRDDGNAPKNNTFTDCFELKKFDIYVTK